MTDREFSKINEALVTPEELEEVVGGIKIDEIEHGPEVDPNCGVVGKYYFAIDTHGRWYRGRLINAYTDQGLVVWAIKVFDSYNSGLILCTVAFETKRGWRFYDSRKQ